MYIHTCINIYIYIYIHTHTYMFVIIVLFQLLRLRRSGAIEERSPVGTRSPS